MKKLMKNCRHMFSAILLIITTLLCGCSEIHNPFDKQAQNTAEPLAVVFVVANTANTAAPNITSETVQTIVSEAANSCGKLAAVSADGNPELQFDDNMTLQKNEQGASSLRLERRGQEKAEEETQKLSQISANDPEVDYCAAFSMASRLLSQVDCNKYRKQLVIIGSGISTAGLINFSDGLFYSEPHTILNYLRKNDAIPTFTDTNVTWVECGDCEAPQETLTPSAVIRLKNIWKAYFEATGADLTFDSTPPIQNENTKTNFPSVTPIDVPDTLPMNIAEIKKDSESQIDVDKKPIDPIEIPEETLTFKPDSAEFADPEKVSSIIQPVADVLLENPTLHVLCLGEIAGDVQTESGRDLSQQRADKIKNALVELGVSADQITSVGVGIDSPYHVANLAYSNAAAINRKITIIDMRSDTATKILEKASAETSSTEN